MSRGDVVDIGIAVAMTVIAITTLVAIYIGRLTL
jgi:hypothetical protein